MEGGGVLVAGCSIGDVVSGRGWVVMVFDNDESAHDIEEEAKGEHVKCPPLLCCRPPPIHPFLSPAAISHKFTTTTIPPSFKVLARPHYLLATLLLCNSAAMEALPIFLDRLLNPLAAIVISVTAILVFGEIMPQAVCKKYGLQIGAYLSYMVRFLMLATGVVTWPIGKLLDWLLGEQSALFRRAQLKALVHIHAEPDEDGAVSVLTADEVQVIQGALDMATKTAESAMTPLSKVFAVSLDAAITEEMLRKIIERGHSRVPVYDGPNKANIVGVILVKELVLAEMESKKKVRDMNIREVPCLRADIPLYDVLKIFRTGKSHMACLTRITHALEGSVELAERDASAASLAGNSFSSLAAPLAGSREPSQSQAKPGADPGLWLTLRKPSGYAEPAAVPDIIGVITIEDVLEELLQQEIVDETDLYVDNLQTVRPNVLVSLQHLPPSLRRFLTRSLAQSQSPLSATRLRGSPSAAMARAGAGAAAAAAASRVPQAGGAPAAAVDSSVALAAVAGVIGAANDASAHGRDPSVHGRNARDAFRRDEEGAAGDERARLVGPVSNMSHVDGS